MSKDSITLSPNHGLNPSLVRCPICHKNTGGIALLGKLKGDVEAPKYIDGDLCEDCDKVYVTVIEADENRKRTGRIAYLKREVLSEQFRDQKALLMLPDDFQNLFVEQSN